MFRDQFDAPIADLREVSVRVRDLHVDVQAIELKIDVTWLELSVHAALIVTDAMTLRSVHLRPEFVIFTDSVVWGEYMGTDARPGALIPGMAMPGSTY